KVWPRYTDTTGQTEILQALAAMEADDPLVLNTCKTIFSRDPPTRLSYRIAALDVYGSWAIKDEKRDKEFVGLLKSVMTKDPRNQTLNIACAKYAEQMGPRAAVLIPELKKMNNSIEGPVREAATKALAKVDPKN